MSLQNEPAKLDLQKRITDLNDQILVMRQKFNPNNVYSFIPLLIVRLGAIILLLFLTQMLLSLYRYNSSVSAHFDSVADALRMVSKQDDEAGPNSVEFLDLINALNPKDHSYLLPDSPISAFAELFKKK